MHKGFTDFERFIRDLLRAINDEAEAINFYRVLYDMATNERHREYIREARNDEKRHFNLLSRLYRKLAGVDPVIELGGHRHHSSSSSSHHKHHHHSSSHHKHQFSFVQGIQKAFDDEQAAYILYRDLILMTSIPAVRDILLVPLTDENEHAQKFNWIFTDLIRIECCLAPIEHDSSSSKKHHCKQGKNFIIKNIHISDHHKHHSKKGKHKHKHHSSSSSSSHHHKHHSDHKHCSDKHHGKHKHHSDHKKHHGKHKHHSDKKHHNHKKHHKH